MKICCLISRRSPLRVVDDRVWENETGRLEGLQRHQRTAGLPFEDEVMVLQI